jgi:acylphosphatase
MKSVKLEVHGRVQGVNFRVMVKRKADSLGLVGYILNLESGEVEIIVVGLDEKVRELIEYIEGSPGACKVENVLAEEIKNGEDYSGFEIRRERSFLRDQKKSFGNLGKRILKI